MSEEKINNEKCKECGEKLKEEEKIYCGYCEKCYNKWIKKKEKLPKEKESNENMIDFFSYACGLIAITILIIFFMIVIFWVFNPINLIVNLFKSLFAATSSSYSAEISNIKSSLYLNILVNVSGIFSAIGLVLGGIFVKKYGKSKLAIAGIIMSVICVVIVIFL